MTSDAVPALHDEEYVAGLLGRSADWVLRQCRAKRMPHRRIGTAYRFTDEDISAYIAATAQPASAMNGPDKAGVSPRSRRLRAS